MTFVKNFLLALLAIVGIMAVAVGGTILVGWLIVWNPIAALVLAVIAMAALFAGLITWG